MLVSAALYNESLSLWHSIMYFFQARVHDESLRFVLSDPAILALAEKVPSTANEIFDTIAQADLNAESLSVSFPSPSPVVCSHMDHFCLLFEEKIEDLDDLFRVILQNCIGESGSCPLSVFNYPLLVNSTMKLGNRIVPRQNGSKNAKQVARKASRQLFVQKFSCKSPVYHNCRIYANDGRLLCYCDRRKLEWLGTCHSTISFNFFSGTGLLAVLVITTALWQVSSPRSCKSG